MPDLPLLALAVACAGLCAGLLWVVLALRDPRVRRLSAHPEQLLEVSLADAAGVDRALGQAFRRTAVLAAARLPQERWKRLVGASKAPAALVPAVAQALGLKLGTKVPGHEAWEIDLPELRLRFPRRAALALTIREGDSAELGTAVRGTARGLLLLDASPDGTVAGAARAPGMPAIVLDSKAIRTLLLSDAPRTLLEQAVATQRPRAEISPFQLSGGVEDERLFFGRDSELQAITERPLRNYLLVAPRQMGKSSLLKAAVRRLSARADLDVHLLTLVDEHVPASIARHLGKPAPETPEQFGALVAGTRRRPRLWLLDEADAFIVQDSARGYPLCRAMRMLAEEGRAYFVLAGFWHLYSATVLNQNNPLRNFGELVRLSPLDLASARALATDPMTALGLRWADERVVQQLIEQAGGRAHLIAAICRATVEHLGPSAQEITADDVQAALRSPAVLDELKFWRREALGRAVLRAALLGAPPTRVELRERLGAAGIDPPEAQLAATVDKLELGWVLVADADGRLTCPVPLLRRALQREGDLAAGLAQDAAELRETASRRDVEAARPPPGRPRAPSEAA